MERLSYDYSLLRGRIKKKFGTDKEFSQALGIDPTSLSNKLNNKSYFSQEEIEKSCTLLEIDKNEINGYFFCLEC